MPPVFIQPGLGESLNRYLERLGRRGEEQRRLTAQRDNLQARMDARAAEVRTRMISQSIDQAVGLFTDEMQRDRASQRRLGEAEEMLYLRGKPARQAAAAAYGLTNIWNSKLRFVNKETGIGNLLAQTHARLEASPNTLSPEDKRTKLESEAWLQQFAKQFAADELSQEHYVRGTLEVLSVLDFEPSGPPKKRLKPNTVMGTGFGPDNNGLFAGIPYNVDPQTGETEPVNLPDGMAEALAEIRDNAESAKTAKWDKWNKGDKKGGEPREYLNDVEMSAWILRKTDPVVKQYQAAYGNADPANVARETGGLSKFEVDDEGNPAGGGLRPSAETPATAFMGLPNKKLDALVKEAGRPLVLQDEQGQDVIIPNKDGQPCYLFYMGNGEVERVPLKDLQRADQAISPGHGQDRPPPWKGLVPPGVMKQ